MSPKAFTACGRADAHSAHLSIHLTRGEALRQDTLRACCSIFLALTMKRWPDADRSSFLFAQLEALFIRGVVLLEPAQINREICLFWANRGCKSGRGSSPAGWEREDAGRAEGVSNQRTGAGPSQTLHTCNSLTPLPNHPHPHLHTTPPPPPHPTHLDVVNVMRLYDMKTRNEQELAEVIAHCLWLFPRLGGKVEGSSLCQTCRALFTQIWPPLFAELVGFPAREEILT